MAWQLPHVQTVYRGNIIAIAPSQSSSEYWISVRDIYDLSCCENGLSNSWKQSLEVDHSNTNCHTEHPH